MTGRVVHLNRERWLALANLAAQAVADPTPSRRDEVKIAAGRMVSATPPSTDPFAMSLCLAFRWGCTAFACCAGGAERLVLGDALVKQVMAIRRLFEHVSPPSDAVAMARPVPAPRTLFDGGEPSWTQRKDIAG